MFNTELVEKRVINLKSTYKLVEPLIWDDGITRIVVPSDFIYNGASVPWLFTRLIPKKGKEYDKAVCLHDWLFGTRLFSLKFSNEIFYKAMIADNTNKLLAKAMRLSVDLFGRKAYNQNTAEEVAKLKSL